MSARQEGAHAGKSFPPGGKSKYEEKKAIRITMGVVLGKMPLSQAADSGILIRNLLEPLIDKHHAQAIVGFVPSRYEPDILPYLSKKARESENIGLVRLPAQGSLLDVRLWNGDAENLERVPGLDILQPADSLPPITGLLNIPAKRLAVLVPGVAFTIHGVRLGRGKGWYDKFLAHFPDCLRIGVCFEEQIVSRLPSEEHDQAMDYIVTQTGIRRCGTK